MDAQDAASKGTYGNRPETEPREAVLYGGADSDDPALRAVLDAWPRLTEAARRTVRRTAERLTEKKVGEHDD